MSLKEKIREEEAQEIDLSDGHDITEVERKRRAKKELEENTLEAWEKIIRGEVKMREIDWKEVHSLACQLVDETRDFIRPDFSGTEEDRKKHKDNAEELVKTITVEMMIE